MAVEDLITNRDMAAVKMKSLLSRLKQAVESENERAVKSTKQQMADTMKLFESLHSQIIVKMKAKATDPELLNEYLPFEAMAIEADELVTQFEQKLADIQLAVKKCQIF